MERSKNMLDLIGFKAEFVSQCRSTLRESGPVDMEIEERMVNKAQRGELNGLLFRKEGLDCAPTFYVEDFYKSYKSGSSIEELSHTAVDCVVESLGMAEMFAAKANALFGGHLFETQNPDGTGVCDPDGAGVCDPDGAEVAGPGGSEGPGKDAGEALADPGLFTVRVLNKSMNRDYLNDVAFREAGCGFVFIAEIEDDEYRLVITNGLLKETGMTADELFDRALNNTAEKYPALLHDLAESAMAGTEDCRNLLEGPAGRAPAGAGPGFVLTNSRFFWGAGALFYPGMMERIRQLLGSDFYVLPSSVHELILVRVEDQDPQQLADLVRSANRAVVREDEVLADDLYVCEDGELHRVSYGGEIPACKDLMC